ncbi:unnamed protein product [Cuscuta campestris]|uniref:Peptidase A1 domain-containing protein n=1 Tax=Cuscuta campestris TaxID=132261 RepID=A0A484NM95_9ASTE|nr:unnamed protein product [Cuscuta campestris]
MASHLKNNLVLVVFILAPISAATFITSGGAQENGGGAFTIELVHRDSPASPLYDTLLSQRQRMKSAFRHSLGRLVRTGGGDSPASVRVLPDPKGTYLVRFSVGAAPSATVRLAVADTGSDLIWLQCRPPCRGVHCSGQNDSLVFSPGASRTYKPVHCRSKECTGLPGSRCGRAHKTCLYYARYNDGTYSHGEIAKDTFTLDLSPPAERVDFPTGDLRTAAAMSFSEKRHNVSFPDIIFGCGESNHFGNNDTEVSGIVGLGSSPYSLVNQIGGLRFSYCLVPLSHLNVSSKLQFGSLRPALALQGLPGVVSTPLVLKPQATFYYLTLLGISVENQTLVESATTSQGNIYIDSGTTFTFLPTNMYAGLEEMVKKSIRLEPMKPNPRRFLGLCYEDLAPEHVPTMRARFEGGEVRLNPANTFVNIGDGVGCLAFAPTKGVPVFGNVAHTNFLVEYDLEKMVVSFMPTDCVNWKY